MTRKNTMAGKADDALPHDGAAEAHVVETVHILQPEGVQELRAGSLLVVCAQPGFKRAGIEHERLHVYRDGELTLKQLGQMRREPKLTLIEVG